VAGAESVSVEKTSSSENTELEIIISKTTNKQVKLFILNASFLSLELDKFIELKLYTFNKLGVNKNSAKNTCHDKIQKKTSTKLKKSFVRTAFSQGCCWS